MGLFASKRVNGSTYRYVTQYDEPRKKFLNMMGNTLRGRNGRLTEREYIWCLNNYAKEDYYKYVDKDSVCKLPYIEIKKKVVLTCLSAKYPEEAKGYIFILDKEGECIEVLYEAETDEKISKVTKLIWKQK